MTKTTFSLNRENSLTLHYILDAFSEKRMPCICDNCSPRYENLTEELLPQLQSLMFLEIMNEKHVTKN